MPGHRIPSARSRVTSPRPVASRPTTPTGVGIAPRARRLATAFAPPPGTISEGTAFTDERGEAFETLQEIDVPMGETSITVPLIGSVRRSRQAAAPDAEFGGATVLAAVVDFFDTLLSVASSDYKPLE